MSTLPQDSKCYICHHPRSVYRCSECGNTTCAMCKIVRCSRILCRICHNNLYPKPVPIKMKQQQQQQPTYCSHCSKQLHGAPSSLQAAETASLRMSWTCLPIQNTP